MLELLAAHRFTLSNYRSTFILATFLNSTSPCTVVLPRVLVPRYDVISVQKAKFKTFRSLTVLVVHLLISHQTTSIQLVTNYIKHLSSKLFCVLSRFSPKSKRIKFPQVDAKISNKINMNQKVLKRSAQARLGACIL